MSQGKPETPTPSDGASPGCLLEPSWCDPALLFSAAALGFFSTLTPHPVPAGTSSPSRLLMHSFCYILLAIAGVPACAVSAAAPRFLLQSISPSEWHRDWLVPGSLQSKPLSSLSESPSPGRGSWPPATAPPAAVGESSHLPARPGASSTPAGSGRNCTKGECLRDGRRLGLGLGSD